MTEKINIRQKIEQGWVRSRIVFEMVGKPPEHIQQTLRGYVDILKKNKGIIILHEEFGDPEKHEGYWSTFAEVELLVEGIEKFVYICVSFTPANIEILEPEELTFTDKNLTDWLNELLSLLHEVGSKAKETNMSNELYLHSLNALMRNVVVLALQATPQLTEKQICEKTGVELVTLKPFLEALVKENRIAKKGDKYMIV